MRNLILMTLTIVMMMFVFFGCEKTESKYKDTDLYEVFAEASSMS